MGDQLYHIKGYAEWLIISRMIAQRDQETMAARTIAGLYWTEVSPCIDETLA